MAVIRQSGTGNQFTIVQTALGQYTVLDQTGTNNSSNNVTSRGPVGGSNTLTFTPPAGSQ